jgi:hypothetical protein
MKAAHLAEWLHMYSKWFLKHEREAIMRRVAVLRLIEAIHATDYGDFNSRNDLVARLCESAHSFESTVILLGCCGGFEFAITLATPVPGSRATGLLPPLSPSVA